MGDSVLPLSIANQANGVDEMNQQFEVGQRVKIVDHDLELTLGSDVYKTVGKTGVIMEINNPSGYHVDLTHKVKLDDTTPPCWYKIKYLELIDDPTPQPVASIQYPPLRNMENGKPLSTWKQLLRVDAWAVSAQPHLYFLGHYRSDIYDLEQFAKDTPNFILMSTIACSNAALGGSETQPYHTVFVITEGV